MKGGRGSVHRGSAVVGFAIAGGLVVLLGAASTEAMPAASTSPATAWGAGAPPLARAPGATSPAVSMASRAATAPRVSSTPRVVAYRGHVIKAFCAYRSPCYGVDEQVWTTTPGPRTVNGAPGWILTGPDGGPGQDVAPAAAVAIDR